MRRVEEFLRSDNVKISPKDEINIKFHLAMFATRLLANNSKIKPSQLGGLKLQEFDDEFLKKSFDLVWEFYQASGANDKVSKGSEFVAVLNAHLANFTSRRRPALQ
jgi:hypothetical protein